MFESRPSKKTTQVPIEIRSGGAGVTQTLRFDVDSSKPLDIVLPKNVTSGIFKNSGSVALKLLINSSGSDAWGLGPGEKTAPISIVNASIMVVAESGTGVIECFLEG